MSDRAKLPSGEIYTAYLDGQLKLSKHGEWWHEGVAFTHSGLIRFFHRSIVLDGPASDPRSCSWMLRIGDQQATFECEDTAYFVARLIPDRSPWQAELADGQVLDFVAPTLLEGSEHQIYWLLPSGHLARFMRPAHQVLLQYTSSDGGLLIDGNATPLLPAPKNR